MITQKTRAKIQTHIPSSLPHQKCTWEGNIYSPPGYTPGNFPEGIRESCQRADLQQNNSALVKQEPLPLAVMITPDQFPGRQSNQVISLIRGFYEGFMCSCLARIAVSQVVACLKDWEITDSRSNNSELLPAKAQILQSEVGKQPPTPRSHWWLKWNFVLRTVLAHALPIIKLSQRLHLPARDRFPRKWEAPGAGFSPCTCIPAPLNRVCPWQNRSHLPGIS